MPAPKQQLSSVNGQLRPWMWDVRNPDAIGCVTVSAVYAWYLTTGKYPNETCDLRHIWLTVGCPYPFGAERRGGQVHTQGDTSA